MQSDNPIATSQKGFYREDASLSKLCRV